MNSQVDIRPLLEQGNLLQNQYNDILFAMKNPSPLTSVCPVCNIQIQARHFYKISQKCQNFGHYFCLDCICRQLRICIDRNEEMCCIIDGCPNRMCQNSNFFPFLPKQLNDDYVLWKNSPQYRKRSKTLRMSFRERVSFHIKSKIEDNSLIQEDSMTERSEKQLILEQVNQNWQQSRQQLKKGKLNQTSVKTDVSQRKQENKKMSKKKKPKKRSMKDKRNIQDKQQQERMPVVAEHYPLEHPLRKEKVEYPNKKEILRIAYEHRPYTFCRIIAKTILLLIGLPLAIVEGTLFLVFSVTFYLLFSASILIMLGFFGGCIYYSLYRQEQLVLSFVCLLGIVIGIGIFRFCLDIQEMIQYLLIKNMWILWLKQMRIIWNYPNHPNYIFS